MVSDWGNFSFIFKDDLHKPQNRGVWYSFTTRKKSLQFHSWYLFTHNLSYDVYYNNFAQRQAEYHSAVLYKTELGLFHRKKCNRTPPSPPPQTLLQKWQDTLYAPDLILHSVLDLKYLAKSLQRNKQLLLIESVCSVLALLCLLWRLYWLEIACHPQ